MVWNFRQSLLHCHSSPWPSFTQDANLHIAYSQSSVGATYSPLLLIRRRNTLPSIYFEMAEVNPAPATAVQLRLRRVLVSDELDDSCLDILRSGVCYFVDYRLRSYSWRKRKSSVGAT